MKKFLKVNAYLLMKISVIPLILLMTAFCTIAKDMDAQMYLSKKITVKENNKDVKHVLCRIEKLAGIKFLYSPEFIKPDRKIDVNIENKKLSDALTQILAPLAISYDAKNNGYIFLDRKNEEVKKIEGVSTYSEEKFMYLKDKWVPEIIVTGMVTDEKGIVLQGASVRAKGSEKGATTNADGRFRLVVKDSDKILTISFTGYLSIDITLGQQTDFTIKLTSLVNHLDEVVVIGFGTRKKKDLTGAVSVIDATSITKSTALTPELAMQGQMAGVSVTSGGGNPSARPTIRIRGVSSFNNADPLYVIDGIPIEEGGAGATTDGTNDPVRRTPINLYTIVNSNDIETITVLKDASATAPYGVRGGNGVILITTKSGKKGKAKVDFDGVYGSQNIPKKYGFLNTQQYTKYTTDAYNANPQLNGINPVPIGQADRFGPVWDPSSAKYLGNSATYDWQDAIINHSSKTQNYNVRVSGASDNDATSYNFSAGYANNDGSFLGVNSERYSISSNVRSSIGKYFETGLNIRLVNEKTTLPGGRGGYTGDLGAFKAAPWQAIYDKNNPYGYAALFTLNQPITPGTPLTTPAIAPVFDISPVWESRPDAFVPITNYLGMLATNTNSFIHQTALGSVYFQAQPITGLKIKGTVSGQQLSIAKQGYSSFDDWQYYETPTNPYGGVKNAVAGTRYNNIQYDNSITTNLIKSLSVDYVKNLGKHNINITLNGSQEDWLWKTNGGSGYITTDNPDLRYLHIDGTQNGYDELHGHYSLIGYFGRISYNYNSRFYLDVIARRDGSSRFDPDHQWGTFPAGSAAWRISQENFMKQITFVNELKIRGGYGVLGNEQTTGGWKYLSISGSTPPSYNIGTSNSIYPGVAFGNFANRNLTWEKIKSANIGFDALMFDNTLSLTVDYFHKVTNGIIQSVALTPSAGFESPADLNIADVLNRGFEFSAGYNKSIGKVNISLSANFTTIHNEVLKLNDHQAQRGNTYSLEEGKPIGFLYGYKVGGIFQNQKQIDDWNSTHKDNVSTQQKPGDIYFQDLYGANLAGSTAHNITKDSIINDNDQTYLGKTIPGYDYGFTLSANYLGFDISAFFHGVGDVVKYNDLRAQGEAMNAGGRNQLPSVLNSWTPTHPSTTMPRAVYDDPNSNNRFSDRFIENGSYLRLQNLQIGYTLPKSLLNKTKTIQSLRLYVSGINLFTITKYTGADPENTWSPSTRQFLAGINASF